MMSLIKWMKLIEQIFMKLWSNRLYQLQKLVLPHLLMLEQLFSQLQILFMEDTTQRSQFNKISIFLLPSCQDSITSFCSWIDQTKILILNLEDMYAMFIKKESILNLSLMLTMKNSFEASSL